MTEFAIFKCVNLDDYQNDAFLPSYASLIMAFALLCSIHPYQLESDRKPMNTPHTSMKENEDINAIWVLADLLFHKLSVRISIYIAYISIYYNVLLVRCDISHLSLDLQLDDDCIVYLGWSNWNVYFSCHDASRSSWNRTPAIARHAFNGCSNSSETVAELHLWFES